MSESGGRKPTRSTIMMGIADGITVRDLLEQHVATSPTREFLVYEDPDTGLIRRYTYASFDAACNQTANHFLKWGIGHGDRVGVQLCNSVEFVLCLFALAKIGAVTVPLNASYTHDECQGIFDAVGVKALVVDVVALEATATDTLVERVLVVGSGDERDFDEALAQQPTHLRSRVALASDDLIEIMFTSGSTSKPKGVMLTHYNFVFSGYYVNWELSMTDTDRYLSTMAASHVNLQLSALLPALTAGATLILVRRYSATRFWNQARAHHATLVQGMAMIVRTMLRQPAAEGEREHHVREMHYFLPITDEEKADFEQRFGVRLFNTYGSTECLVGAITDLPVGPRKWPSIGRAGLGYEVRIVDQNGNDLPAGEMGEILIRGDRGRTMMLGYWDDPEATAAAFLDDVWLRTGDCGTCDADGWFTFIGRRVDLIKRAGENISAAEVEDVLRHFPGVDDVAVIGQPDGIRDEIVKAFVVAQPGVTVTVDEIRHFAGQHLAYFKVPAIVEFCQSIPRGNYGKICRNILRKRTRKEDHDQN